jgi:hypothetical protein
VTATMSSNIRESFPTGRTLAATLTGTARFVAAEKMLESHIDLPVFGTVVALPQFAIVEFEGREAINRIQWDAGMCVHVVSDDADLTLHWKIEDSSLPTQTGTFRVVPAPGGGHTSAGDLPRLAPGTEPRLIAGISSAAMRRHLSSGRDEGKVEMFSLVMFLLPYVRQSVESAARRVYREIHDVPSAPDATVIPVIDQVESDIVVDKILYGEEGQDCSMMTRLLRRVAATDAVVKKSVMQFISTAIWSSAETHVRAYIGDPHAGRVIRRLARLICSAEPHVVLAAYREAYPNAQMGLARIRAALTSGATIGAQQVAYDRSDGEAPRW